jgi:shikimate dehydrogenase
MIRACVIGWPIEHSRSPIIHGYWLRSLGIAGSYTRVAVAPDALPRFLSELADQNYAGCNVTVPHKETAFALVHECDEAATAIGAINTIWRDGARLYASNTDAYGYLTYLDLTAPQWRSFDAPVVILGAGGAARAILHAFLTAGVERIELFNRSQDRAEALARHFGPRVRTRPWAERSRAAAAAGVLVNTTTLGMNGVGNPEVDFACANPHLVVSDIIYVPLVTPLIADAQHHGLATVDGLGMLLHQAVPGFMHWFGVRPTVTDELYDLVRADIEGRA